MTRSFSAALALVASLTSVAFAGTPHDGGMPPKGTITIGPFAMDATRKTIEKKFGPGKACGPAGDSELKRYCYTDGRSLIEVEYEGELVMGLVAAERDTHRPAAPLHGGRIASWLWNGKPVFTPGYPASLPGWRMSTTGKDDRGFASGGYQVDKSFDSRTGWNLAIGEE